MAQSGWECTETFATEHGDAARCRLLTKATHGVVLTDNSDAALAASGSS
jgi:hypothetical protein